MIIKVRILSVLYHHSRYQNVQFCLILSKNYEFFLLTKSLVFFPSKFILIDLETASVAIPTLTLKLDSNPRPLIFMCIQNEIFEQYFLDNIWEFLSLWHSDVVKETKTQFCCTICLHLQGRHNNEIQLEHTTYEYNCFTNQFHEKDGRITYVLCN